MKVFGAEAYALVPKQLRRKLDKQSELRRFVGYSDGKKGYRIALPSGEVTEAADIVFIEDSNARRPPSPDTEPNQHEMVHLDQEEPDDGPHPDPLKDR